MDVLEHLSPSLHAPLLLETLPRLGSRVFVNLVSDSHADGTVHHPVDIERLTAMVRAVFPDVATREHGEANGSCTRLLLYATGDDQKGEK